jgi:hypothetical protein
LFPKQQSKHRINIKMAVVPCTNTRFCQFGGMLSIPPHPSKGKESALAWLYRLINIIIDEVVLLFADVAKSGIIKFYKNLKLSVYQGMLQL